MMQALVEPLSLCSALGEDKSRPLPFVGAKGVGGEQLAKLGSSSSDGGDFGGDPITFCKQGVVHACPSAALETTLVLSAAISRHGWQLD